MGMSHDRSATCISCWSVQAGKYPDPDLRVLGGGCHLWSPRQGEVLVCTGGLVSSPLLQGVGIEAAVSTGPAPEAGGVVALLLHTPTSSSLD